MKEFDLKAAKAGKPICTRSGEEVEILKWDARGECPIIGCIKDKHRSYDWACSWSINGNFCAGVSDNEADLMMADEIIVSKKKNDKEWIKDLKIGDFIRNSFTKRNGKIIAIEENFLILKISDKEGHSYFINEDYEDIEPIPISEKILKDNEFKYNKGTAVWTYEDYDINIFLLSFLYMLNTYHHWGFHSNIEGEFKGDLYIDNVHELQHALSLCKINKKIKL